MFISPSLSCLLLLSKGNSWRSLFEGFGVPVICHHSQNLGYILPYSKIWNKSVFSRGFPFYLKAGKHDPEAEIHLRRRRRLTFYSKKGDLLPGLIITNSLAFIFGIHV